MYTIISLPRLLKVIKLTDPVCVKQKMVDLWSNARKLPQKRPFCVKHKLSHFLCTHRKMGCFINEIQLLGQDLTR